MYIDVQIKFSHMYTHSPSYTSSLTCALLYTSQSCAPMASHLCTLTNPLLESSYPLPVLLHWPTAATSHTCCAPPTTSSSVPFDAVQAQKSSGRTLQKYCCSVSHNGCALTGTFPLQAWGLASDVVLPSLTSTFLHALPTDDMVLL